MYVLLIFQQLYIKTYVLSQEILKALEKIPTRVCLANVVKCQPIQHLPVLAVLAIAQNLGRPSLLTPLEAIILHPLAPVHVKVHTINCIRPITRVAPNRVRQYRNLSYVMNSPYGFMNLPYEFRNLPDEIVTLP